MNAIGKFLKALVGVVLIFAAIAWWFSRPDTGGNAAPVMSSTDREAAWIERGKDAVRSVLKDGESAKFEGVFFHNGRDGVPVACGRVNSKNSFGAYGGAQRFVSAGKPELTYIEEQVQDFGTVWKKFCQ